jgi:uncharacterized protein (DUF2235 family)
MKRIAIFCDGTWNTPDEQEDGKPCMTNVVRLAGAISKHSDDGALQKLYYDTGVGSEGGILKRSFDGATGTGISKNIMEAYRFLSYHYEPGDQLFLFGFSRGAFTVRSLCGLIRNSGILDQRYIDRIPQAYNLYKARGAKFHPRSEEAVLFRKTYSLEDITPIHFIGVWDTVGALGNPLVMKGIVSERNEFHDTEISSKIQNAYQALAIDEKRRNFQTTLWKKPVKSETPVMEQVWFCGVHSDIGGGYPEASVSDISLVWMRDKAVACGLSFDPLAVNPDPLAPLHESYQGLYKFFPRFYRPIGQSFPGFDTHESLHPSVMERYQQDPGYRPLNLTRFLQ